MSQEVRQATFAGGEQAHQRMPYQSRAVIEAESQYHGSWEKWKQTNRAVRFSTGQQRSELQKSLHKAAGEHRRARAMLHFLKKNPGLADAQVSLVGKGIVVVRRKNGESSTFLCNSQGDIVADPRGVVVEKGGAAWRGRSGVLEGAAMSVQVPALFPAKSRAFYSYFGLELIHRSRNVRNENENYSTDIGLTMREGRVSYFVTTCVRLLLYQGPG